MTHLRNNPSRLAKSLTQQFRLILEQVDNGSGELLLAIDPELSDLVKKYQENKNEKSAAMASGLLGYVRILRKEKGEN